MVGTSQGQDELLDKPALVAAIHYTDLRSWSCPRADADGGPRKQQNPHTGCSDAVYLTAHPVFACGNGGKANHFLVQPKMNSS